MAWRPGRRSLRLALLGLVAPFGLGLIWFLAGFAGALWPGAVQPHPGPAQVEIRLVGTAIHYDLALPLTPDLRHRFAFVAQDGVAVHAPDAAWLLVGWGARGFYTTAGSYADIPVKAVAQAALQDQAVIRLEAWRDFAPEDLPESRQIFLSAAGYQALLARVEADLTDRRALPGASLTGQDAFYPAESQFSALRTCNVWIGEVLRAAGLPLGQWTPSPQSLRLSLWWHG